jgi:hypothetical protein
MPWRAIAEYAQPATFDWSAMTARGAKLFALAGFADVGGQPSKLTRTTMRND